MKRGKLEIKIAFILFVSLLLMGAAIFGPALTFDYWQGWLFLSFLFIPMLFVLFYMLKFNRKLLEKRIKIREKRERQKGIQLFNTFIFAVVMIVAGLDHRFSWSSVPVWGVIAADVLMLSGYLMFIKSMLHNEYASRIIEVQRGQKLIDTGPYAVVRHPMYASAILMYIFIPVTLGSFWAIIPLLLIPIMLVFRIFDEEKALVEGLKGYKAYMKKVRYRMIPGVW